MHELNKCYLKVYVVVMICLPYDSTIIIDDGVLGYFFERPRSILLSVLRLKYFFHLLLIKCYFLL